MKFLLPDTKLYNACAGLLRIIIVNIVVVIGILSVAGINFSLMMAKEIFEYHSIKAFLRCVTLKVIFQSIVASLVSTVLVLLSYFNNFYLSATTNILRWIYLFLLVFIIYCIIVFNLFFMYVIQKKITLSQLFSIATINYPKFIFFFSIASAIAVLMNTILLYALVICYIGVIIYIIYRIEMPYIQNVLDNKHK